MTFMPNKEFPMAITPTDIEHELSPVDIIVSKSDAKGDITYANLIFIKLSCYTKYELMEQPHSIIRHPDMPRIVFKFLWDNLHQGKEVYAFVKNLSKDGGFYWVFAYIRVANNPDGTFRNYVSTRRAASKKARELIEPLYRELLIEEEKGGMEASLAYLDNYLQNIGASLDTFNETMQALQNS